MFDPFAHMNQMMNQMMDPFGMMNQQQQQQQRGQRSNNNGRQLQQQQNQLMDPFGMNMHSMMMSPFGGHNQIMSMMNSMQQPDIVNGNNSQVFSSSSVVSYTNGSDGKPKVYQESSQMRQGPNGVRETKKMVRDSERGIEKMAVGHHIGDRAHVIERQRDRNGEIEEVVNLENLDDEEVPEFNREFEGKIVNQMRHNKNNHHGHHLNNNHQPFAIEDSHSHRKAQREKERKSKHHSGATSSKQSKGHH